MFLCVLQQSSPCSLCQPFEQASKSTTTKNRSSRLLHKENPGMKLALAINIAAGCRSVEAELTRSLAMPLPGLLSLKGPPRSVVVTTIILVCVWPKPAQAGMKRGGGWIQTDSQYRPSESIPKDSLCSVESYCVSESRDRE